MRPPKSIFDINIFNTLFEKEILLNINQKYFLSTYRSFESKCNNSFLSAKKAEYDVSILQFDECMNYLQKLKATNFNYLLMLDCYIPKKAYLNYKINNLPVAKFLTLKSIVINNRLFIKRRSDLFTFIQIQQFHNLSRIYFSIKNKFIDAIKLTLNVLKFLIANSDNILKLVKPISYFDNQKKLIKYLLFYQIFIEFVRNISKVKCIHKDILLLCKSEIKNTFTSIDNDEFDVLLQKLVCKVLNSELRNLENENKSPKQKFILYYNLFINNKLISKYAQQ